MSETTTVPKLKRKDIKRLEGEALLRAEQELARAREIFKNSMSQYDQTKENIVRGLAEELEGIFPKDQHHKIASKIKSYFAKVPKDGELELISKTTIYRVLDVKYKDEERSTSISSGKSHHGTSTTYAEPSLNGSGENPDPEKNGDQYGETEGETVEDIINKLRDTAQESGEYYIVPRVLLDKLFTRYAPKVAA